MSGSWPHVHSFINSLPFPLSPPSSTGWRAFSASKSMAHVHGAVWFECTRTALTRPQRTVKFTDLWTCPVIIYRIKQDLFRQTGSIITVSDAELSPL